MTYLNSIECQCHQDGCTSIRDAGSIVTGLPATIGQDPTGSYGKNRLGRHGRSRGLEKVLTPLEVAAIYTAARNVTISGFMNLPVSLSLQNLGGNQLQLTTTGTLQSADNPRRTHTPICLTASLAFRARDRGYTEVFIASSCRRIRRDFDCAAGGFELAHRWIP